MTVEQVRAAYERWYSLVESGVDLLTALRRTSSAQCLVHSQNGEVGDIHIADAQIAQMRALFPELELQVDHLMVTADRVVAQMTLEGSAMLPFRSSPGPALRSIGALVARVDDQSDFAETWSYMNPAAGITFPPRTKVSPPQQPEGEPGGEPEARALYATWSRGITGTELVERIVETAAPNCLVHATNGDDGRVDLIEEEFAVVASAFPDLTVRFEDAVYSGDRFIAQFILSGTHRGPLAMMSPTGRHADSTGAIEARVDSSGRALELWIYLAPGMGLLFPRTQEPRE